MSTVYEDGAPNPGLIPYRVTQLESFKSDTEAWRREVDEDRTDFKYVRSDVQTLKRLAIGAIVSLVGGSVSVTISILLATGKF